MKIKIAHIAGGLTTGGVEAVIYEYFSCMNRDDYELYYISYSKPDEAVQRRFEELGFHVYEVAKKMEHPVASTRQVIEILKKNNIQIIHSHMTIMCFVTSFLASLCGIKVRIAHSHLAQDEPGVKSLLRAPFSWLTKVTSTHYMACGENAARYLYGERTVRKGKVMLVRNAVDVERFGFQEEIRRQVRKELGIEGKLCVGHVGRFTDQKNHTFLIDIFSEIVKLNKEAVLLLLGDGELEDKIREKVKTLSLEDNVIFLGSVQDSWKYYQGMDIFLMPSIYEGLPVSLVEAQCSGLPVVMSDTITQEVRFTDSCESLSLAESPESWAAAVCAKADSLQDSTQERGKACEAVKRAGYDIKVEACRLDEFYKKASSVGK